MSQLWKQIVALCELTSEQEERLKAALRKCLDEIKDKPKEQREEPDRP